MIKHCKWYPVCPLKRFYENGKIDKKWVENYCWNQHKNCVRYELEEKGIFHPDNMLPDGSVDKKIGVIK